MRLYALTQSSAPDWPYTAPPFVTHDINLAAQTWVDWVVEALTGRGEVDQDDLSMVRSIAGQFVENPDDPEFDLEWIVGSDGPVNEMVTYEIHVISAPALTLISRLVKR